MRIVFLLFLVCLGIGSCTNRSQQILGSWCSVEHYEQDSTKYPYVNYLDGITVYEFQKDNTFKERHYIEAFSKGQIVRTHDQLRYTGSWHLSGDTLVIHKTLKELRPYYGDMDTTEVDESEIYFIQSLTRDSLIAKMRFYGSYLDVRLEHVKDKKRGTFLYPL